MLRHYGDSLTASDLGAGSGTEDPFQDLGHFELQSDTLVWRCRGAGAASSRDTVVDSP